VSVPGLPSHPKGFRRRWVGRTATCSSFERWPALGGQRVKRKDHGLPSQLCDGRYQSGALRRFSGDTNASERKVVQTARGARSRAAPLLSFNEGQSTNQSAGFPFPPLESTHGLLFGPELTRCKQQGVEARWDLHERSAAIERPWSGAQMTHCYAGRFWTAGPPLMVSVALETGRHTAEPAKGRSSPSPRPRESWDEKGK